MGLKHLSLSQMVKMYLEFWGKKTEIDQDQEDEIFNPGGNYKDIFHEIIGEEVNSIRLDDTKKTMGTRCVPNISFGFMSNQSKDFITNKSIGFMLYQPISLMTNHSLKDTEDVQEEILYASAADEHLQRFMAYKWEQEKRD